MVVALATLVKTNANIALQMLHQCILVRRRGRVTICFCLLVLPVLPVRQVCDEGSMVVAFATPTSPRLQRGLIGLSVCNAYLIQYIQLQSNRLCRHNSLRS